MEKELNIREILNSMKEKLALIIIITLVLAVGVYVYFTVTNVSKYTSTARIICSSTSENTGVIGQSTITASNMLSKTVKELILTEPFMTQVASKINAETDYVGLSASRVGSMISISSLDDTYILVIQATDSDAKLAQIVAQTVSDIASLENGSGIIATLNGGKISGYGEVKQATVPNNPKIVMKTILGAAVGLVSAIVIVVVMYLLDDKIKGQQDVLKKYNVPLLGIIPTRSEK